jgi:hypothetical protein
MRRAVVIAIAIAAVAPAATDTAQDMSADDRPGQGLLPQDRFVGEWVAVDPNATQITRVTITCADGGGLEIVTSAPTYISGKGAGIFRSDKVKLNLLGDTHRAT